MNIKERFLQFNNKGYFSLVDDQMLVELYIGLDEQGRKALKLRGIFEPIKIKSTSSIEIRQFTNEKFSTLEFSLIDNEIDNQFYLFCEDIISIAKDIKVANDSYKIITKRYLQWRKMFGNKQIKLLSEQEILGLLGELYVLQHYLMDKYGQHDALLSWSGQELTHKDFSFDKIWYESKAILKSCKTVKISSIEQLESDYDGVLIVNFFEKMSPKFDGFTLNKYVLKIYNDLSNEIDKELFIDKVALQGFSFNDYYDQFNYAFVNSKLFLVNNEFPKIQKYNINPAIVKAQYEILIKDILKFEIKGI